MINCTYCKTQKSLEEYHRSKRTSTGYSNICKTCAKEYSKIYRLNNREELLQKKQQYYKDNKENYTRKNKEWVQNNKEKVLRAQQEYRLKNRKKISVGRRRCIVARLKIDPIFQLQMRIRNR